ncbi:MAG: MBL fold metallo-hydrolase [Chloroflexota bacterium]
MKLVILGSGGFLPVDAAQTACYFIPEAGVLLDAGSGLYRLPAYLLTSRLDIYLSHAHADHTSGLDYLFASYFIKDLQGSGELLTAENVEKFVQSGNDSLPKTIIHGSTETLDIVQPRYELYHYNWFLLNSIEPLPGSGSMQHFGLENGTTGFRLDWPGHSLAYITDTIARKGSDYIPKIAGVDLLLHDCYTADHYSPLAEKIGHSSLSAVLETAAAAKVKKLVLIHHSPVQSLDFSRELEHCRQIFPDVEIGYDLMLVDF